MKRSLQLRFGWFVSSPSGLHVLLLLLQAIPVFTHESARQTVSQPSTKLNATVPAYVERFGTSSTRLDLNAS